MWDKQKKATSYEDIYNSLLTRLVQSADYLDKKSQDKLKQAFKFAAQYHGSKKRLNGEYLLSHCAEVAIILADLKLDRDCLIAALLHDMNIDGDDDAKKQTTKSFGQEVTFLVEQVRLLVQRLRLTSYKGNDFSAEYLRQMFVATTQDLRAVILKLADRTHDLRSLEGFSQDRILQIAKESLYIDAHIAARLGIYYFKNELENLSFSYTHPEVYAFMESCEEFDIETRRKLADQLVVKTTAVLKEQGVKYIKVKGRAKTYYSIFSKLRRKGGDIGKIYDLIALRVVAESIPECYQSLRVLHQKFTPLGGRFKDFIRFPKIDGYQSLHTTVKDPETGLIFEFQIRTRRMNEFAEYGPVAHWRYKNQTEVELVDFLDPNVLKDINDELTLQGKKQAEKKEVSLYKKPLSLFDDKVFTITADGQVCRLPKGSTIDDYLRLYKPELYRKVFFVKVNNKVCPVSYKINTGDVVDILSIENTELSRVKVQLRKY